MPKFKRRLPRRSHGFMLIEAAVAIIIIGLGVVAMMGLFASGTQVNAYGNDLSTAVFLAEEMRAMTDDVGFNGLRDFDGTLFSAAVDANGQALAGLENYRQELTVEMVDPLTLNVSEYYEPLIRITAVVSYGQKELTRLSWLRIQK